MAKFWGLSIIWGLFFCLPVSNMGLFGPKKRSSPKNWAYFGLQKRSSPKNGGLSKFLGLSQGGLQHPLPPSVAPMIGVDNDYRCIFLDSKFDKITELPPGAAVSGPYHVATILDRGPKDRYLQWLEKASRFQSLYSVEVMSVGK